MVINYVEKARIIAYIDLLLLILGLIILAIVSIIFSFECSDAKFGIIDPDDVLTTTPPPTGTPAPPLAPVPSSGSAASGKGILIGNGADVSVDDDDDLDSAAIIAKDRLVFIGFITRFVIACIFQLIMVILLLESVLLQNYQRCWVWLVVNKVFLTLMFVSGFIMLFIDPASAFVEAVFIVYKFYCLRVVNGFGVELQLQAI